MQLYYLYYFKVVAETENLARASTQLNISQPALSKAISNLESELGIALFDRSKRRISLSKVGREYYRYIARAFESIDAGGQYIERQRSMSENRVTIGTSITDLLSPLINAYYKEYPDSRLELNQYVYEAEPMKEHLRRGDVDFVLTELPVATDEVEQLRLMDEEVLLLVPPNHPLAGELFVRLRDLKEERFIVNNSSFDRQVVIDYCRLAGFEPDISLCSNEPAVIGAALDAGQGVNLAPSNLVFQRHDPNMALALRFTDVDVVRMLTIAYRKDRIFTGEAHRFFQFTKDYFVRYSGELQGFLEDYFPQRDMGQRESLGLNSPSILSRL